jgi:hypothetical protein
LSGDHELALRHLEAASASEGVLGAWIANAARAVSGGILGGTVGRGRAARAEWELRRAGFRDPRIAIRIAMPGLPVAD